MADSTIRQTSPATPAIDYDRIERMISHVLTTVVKPSLLPANDPVALRADYQVTVDVIKLLSDIRFRCLVFITATVTLANAFLAPTADAVTRAVLGALGLVATLGITVYE